MIVFFSKICNPSSIYHSGRVSAYIVLSLTVLSHKLIKHSLKPLLEVCITKEDSWDLRIIKNYFAIIRKPPWAPFSNKIIALIYLASCLNFSLWNLLYTLITRLMRQLPFPDSITFAHKLYSGYNINDKYLNFYIFIGSFDL